MTSGLVTAGDPPIPGTSVQTMPMRFIAMVPLIVLTAQCLALQSFTVIIITTPFLLNFCAMAMSNVKMDQVTELIAFRSLLNGNYMKLP